MKLSTSENILSKTREKETPQRIILEFFLLDTLKTTFWKENSTQRWTQSRPIFTKSGHLFGFWKRARELSSLRPFLLARLWIWLNMHQYPWISLNILENAWMKCSRCARTLNMHGHLTCLTSIWIWFRFQIEHGSKCDTVVYLRVTQSSEHVWLWLYTPQ